MRGRRIPVVNNIFYPKNLLIQPGDYYGPVSDSLMYGGRPCVWFVLPIAGDQNCPEAAKHARLVCSPPHVFTEESDGSLTIRASILCHGYQGDPDVWHGYLTKGIWESC